MKRLLTVISVFLLGTSFACADFYDRTVNHRPNGANPSVSQQMVKSPAEQKAAAKTQGKGAKAQIQGKGAKTHGYSMQPLVGRVPKQAPQMRPGRNYDNPAANRFGDGSQPNSYIFGHGSRHSAAP